MTHTQNQGFTPDSTPIFDEVHRDFWTADSTPPADDVTAAKRIFAAVLIAVLVTVAIVAAIIGMVL
jgi:hypothetical protein